MKFFQVRLFYIFLAGVFFLSACGESESTNQNTNGANRAANAGNNANSTKDDTEEFGKLVNLPLVPEEVTWREVDLKETKRLIAVLKYSSAAVQVIVTQAEKHKPFVPAELEAENWFPPELIAKSQESGDESLKGSAYGANDFYSEIYKNGRLIHVSDTDFFVLELTNSPQN